MKYLVVSLVAAGLILIIDSIIASASYTDILEEMKEDLEKTNEALLCIMEKNAQLIYDAEEIQEQHDLDIAGLRHKYLKAVDALASAEKSSQALLASIDSQLHASIGQEALIADFVTGTMLFLGGNTWLLDRHEDLAKAFASVGEVAESILDGDTE